MAHPPRRCGHRRRPPALLTENTAGQIATVSAAQHFRNVSRYGDAVALLKIGNAFVFVAE